MKGVRFRLEPAGRGAFWRSPSQNEHAHHPCQCFNYPQPELIVSGAEWEFVPGQHLTEPVQRDLEAVIAASPTAAHQILALLEVLEKLAGIAASAGLELLNAYNVIWAGDMAG